MRLSGVMCAKLIKAGLIDNLVFNNTRTSLTEFVVLVHLRMYLPDDDLVDVRNM
jgi:hypothetical protein